jgi:hypothetical protein
MITFRLLTEYDFDFAMQLTEYEKWGCLPCDTKRYMEYEPRGYFIVEVNGKRAGHVFSIGYGKLGWIGLLIVKAEYMRRGYADQKA